MEASGESPRFGPTWFTEEPIILKEKKANNFYKNVLEPDQGCLYLSRSYFQLSQF
jgi:hypothetical protein